MENEINKSDTTHRGGLEYREGCPVCEHSDPELERELWAFAELLLDIYFTKREEQRQSRTSVGIDNVL